MPGAGIQTSCQLVTGVVFAIAAILMLLTMLINLIADLVGRYFRRKQQ